LFSNTKKDLRAMDLDNFFQLGDVAFASESSSLVLKNRFRRTAKVILTQGLVVAISFAIIYFDLNSHCQKLNNDYVGKEFRLYGYDREWMFEREDDFLEKAKLAYEEKMEAENHTYSEGLLAFDCDRTYYVQDWANVTHSLNMKVCLEYKLYYYYYTIFMGILISFPTVLGFFHFIHSGRFAEKYPNFVVDKEIEKIYEGTNSIPFFDTLFEIRIAWRKGSRTLLLLNFFFILVAGVLFALIFYFFSFYLCNLPVLLSVAVANAFYNMYNFFGEINEYWVYCYNSSGASEMKPMKDDEFFNAKLQKLKLCRIIMASESDAKTMCRQMLDAIKSDNDDTGESEHDESLFLAELRDFLDSTKNDESFDQTLDAGSHEEEVDPDLDNNSMSSKCHLESAGYPDESMLGSDEPCRYAQTLTSTSNSHEQGQELEPADIGGRGAVHHGSSSSIDIDPSKGDE